jgi:ribonucleoside-diphosphate reductase alpha chain
MGLCNLSEVIVRPDDTLETLKEKVRIATIIGTFQSTMTNFRYLRNQWRKNAEEERLLGVSLTGEMDHPVLQRVSEEAQRWLVELKQIAIDTNTEWAEKLGIPVSASITCVKPSGTVSQLVDCASGLHGRFSPYYIRTVRADNKDPLAQLMQEHGIPCEPDVTKPHSTYVFSFPMKSPATSRCASDIAAIEQLEIWKMYLDCWCEHNPSVTIYVSENEWIDVMAWVWKNFDSIGGISFLPRTDHVYKQAPYQAISEEEYLVAVANQPSIPWDKLSEYEKDDQTVGSQELACVSGACDLAL